MIGMDEVTSKMILVPEVGLEPTQGFPYRILSPARLPFHHSGTAVLLITKHGFGYKRTM
jgi:hypothetical protein